MKDITPLTKDQTAEYTELDDTITNGAKAFLAVGAALVRMHESGLYRAEFSSFKDYIKSRGISRAHTYRLMSAIQTTLQIDGVSESETRSARENKGDSEKSSGKPASNLSTSALAKLGTYPKEKQADILKLARVSGKPTEDRIAKAAAAIMHESNPSLGTAPDQAAPVPSSEMLNPVLPPNGPTIIEHGDGAHRFRQPLPAAPITADFNPALPAMSDVCPRCGSKDVMHVCDPSKPAAAAIATVADAVAFCKSTDEDGGNWATAAMMLVAEVERLQKLKEPAAETTPLTPDKLLAELRKFKPRIPDTLPQKEREKFGHKINEMVKWLMNPVGKSRVNFYTS